VHYRKESTKIFKTKLTLLEKNIRTSAKKLDADHFNFLKESDFQTILKKVRKYPEHIFPFTYR
ncbi:hypothetical protein, partial [Desulfobacula sp.]